MITAQKTKVLRGLYVTATGTDQGKTYLSALMVQALRRKGYRAGYYKAALSGAVNKEGRLLPGDAAHVATLAGLKDSPEQLVTCLYENPLSPHLAARLEGNLLNLEIVTAHLKKLSKHYDLLIVEGCGGVVCPLRWDRHIHLMQTDLIRHLGIPSVLVTSSGLGTIHSTVTAAHFMASQSLKLQGVVMNRWIGGVMEEDNAVMIEALTNLPVLARVAQGAPAFPLDGDELASLCGEVML